jgi:hypothetical protein
MDRHPNRIRLEGIGASVKATLESRLMGGSSVSKCLGRARHPERNFAPSVNVIHCRAPVA